MKKLQLIAAIITTLLLAGAPSAGSAQEFYQVYETTYDRTSRDILRTPAGEYLIVGASNTSDAADSDLYVLLTDADGKKLWDTLYGGSKPEYAYSMVEAHDGNYIVAGYSQSFGGGDLDVYLLKVTPKGRFIKQTTVDINYGNEEARQIIRTSDNKYLVIGTSRMSSSHNNSQVLLIKIDVNLNVEMTREYGGSDRELGQAIEATSDGGFLLGGLTRSKGAGGNDGYVIKVNNAFDIQWEYTHGTSLDQEVVSLVANSDGSAMLAIRDSLPGTALDGNIDVVLQKIGSDGKAIGATKTYGGSDKDTPKTIRPVTGGGYIVGAISRSWWEGYPQVWLIRTNDAGDQTWVRDYGSLYEHDHCHMIKESHDGGFIMVGHWRQGAIMKVIFLKMNGQGSVGVDENNMVAGFSVYPNPVSGQFINLNFEKAGNYQVRVYDLMGRVVLNQPTLAGGGESVRIEIPETKPGIYTIQVNSEHGSGTKKIIVD